MKNIIRKTCSVALLALPMLSFAASDYTNCGVGTINSLAVKHDGNVIIDMNWLANNPGTGYHEQQSMMVTGVAPEHNAGLRSALLSAFHAGSIVQLLGSGGHCLNQIVAIGLCSTASTCKVSQFMHYDNL